MKMRFEVRHAASSPSRVATSRATRPAAVRHAHAVRSHPASRTPLSWHSSCSVERRDVDYCTKGGAGCADAPGRLYVIIRPIESRKSYLAAQIELSVGKKKKWIIYENMNLLAIFSPYFQLSPKYLASNFMLFWCRLLHFYLRLLAPSVCALLFLCQSHSPHSFFSTLVSFILQHFNVHISPIATSCFHFFLL